MAELWRWFDLALLAGLTGRVDRALEELERASATATPREHVEVALRRARLAVRRGEPTLARELCEDALAGARELAAEDLEAELFLLLAQIDEDYGSIERALEEFERAAKIAERCRASAVEARAWLGASLAAVRLANAARAQDFAERALEAAGGAGDPVLRAEALRHLGNSLRERGDASGALRVYRRAVRAAREGGSPESEAKALNNLGTVCQWVGLVPEALAALERSLVLKERLGLHASAVLTKNNLGALHLAIGRHDEARRELEAIVEEGRESAPVVVALGYSNWGDLCTIEHDFERALDLYRAAHAMNRERDLAGQQSHALSGMVRVLSMRNAPGDVDEAAELLVALERLTEIGDLAETHRRYHTSRAMHFDRIGDPRRALVHARRARTSREDPSAQFSDVFGTVLEARWIEALMLARTGRPAAATRAAQRTASILLRLSRHVGNENDQRVFLEASPLHRAIRAGRLDTPLGWSWFSDESA
jgi:tetratricopeptide (TPR) repeat protein